MQLELLIKSHEQQTAQTQKNQQQSTSAANPMDIEASNAQLSNGNGMSTSIELLPIDAHFVLQQMHQQHEQHRLQHQQHHLNSQQIQANESYKDVHQQELKNQ